MREPGPWREGWDPDREWLRAGPYTSPERFTEQMIEFDPQAIRGTVPLSAHMLDDPRYEQYREEIVRDATGAARMVAERWVYCARLPGGQVTLPVEVTVPYNVTVSVQPPNPWWRRLLRLPARSYSRSAAGTVTAHAAVTVDLNVKYRFPDFNPHIGTGYPTEDVHAVARPVRVVYTDTRPELGAQATVARLELRCPFGDGCGHHWTSHVLRDEIEPGGCTITDCPCTRTPPRGGQVA